MRAALAPAAAGARAALAPGGAAADPKSPGTGLAGGPPADTPAAAAAADTAADARLSSMLSSILSTPLDPKLKPMQERLAALSPGGSDGTDRPPQRLEALLQHQTDLTSQTPQKRRSSKVDTNCTMSDAARWLLTGTCTRGTGVALFDYASFLRPLLGAAEPVVVCDRHPVDHSLVARLRGAFTHVYVDAAQHLTDALRGHRITHLYAHVYGKPQVDGDRRRLEAAISHMAAPVQLAVHAVFDGSQPWGQRFARISETVPGSAPVVPYIVRSRAPHTHDLRARLGISANATVFCSYGGAASFNLDFVRRVVCRLAEEGANASRLSPLIFLFANHEPFCSQQPRWHKARRSRLFHLPNLQHEEKQPFVDTCDAMLHGRGEGETFGSAVAEFSVSNKPVFAYAHPDPAMPHGKIPAMPGTGNGRAHLDILGAKAIVFNQSTLVPLLLSFDRIAAAQRGDWWDAYQPYRPEAAMQRFCRVFY